MYLDIPQDIDIGSGVEAAPIEAVGNLGQSSESSSTARNAIQPIGHVDGSDDEDERMVEMHLSPCKGLSQPEGDIGRLPNVKTEAAKPALHIKREPAHDAAIPIQTDAEPPAGENYEAEETVVEIHVNSKNQRALFGAPVPDRIVKKEEENDQPLVTDDTGGYLVKTEEEESTVVEVHLSAANLQEAFTGLTSVSVKQEHVKEES
ncbi:hypothetical protein C8Q73DRAFT_677678 [Cubamyces lactineus]|nr:hypothetical protein C8Q73DRAFT_677678 [Cubamyces lactineus]